MIDYKNSQIYKLVSDLTDDIYIGSTVRRLSKRLKEHKRVDNTCTSNKMFDNGAVVSIILLEIYPCNNINELLMRELYHINTTLCINKHMPIITDLIDNEIAYKKEYGDAYINMLKVIIKKQQLTRIERIKARDLKLEIAHAERTKANEIAYAERTKAKEIVHAERTKANEIAHAERTKAKEIVHAERTKAKEIARVERSLVLDIATNKFKLNCTALLLKFLHNEIDSNLLKKITSFKYTRFYDVFKTYLLTNMDMSSKTDVYDITEARFGIDLKEFTTIIKKRTNKGIIYLVDFLLLKDYLHSTKT